MTLQFRGGRVWDEITERVGNSPSQVHAAIAYIGKDAPNLLPLKKGDVLVVNASERSLSSGATNPYALEKFMSSGVEVHSAHELHAKVITTEGHTIVGSANASENSSDRCQEAFMVSTTNIMRNSVLQFVNDLLLSHSAPVLAEELPALKQIFDSRLMRTKITGVTSPPERNGLFGDENENYFLCRVQWNGDLTDDEEEYVVNATGSDETNTTDSLYIDSAFQLPSVESGFKPGSIVILHSGGMFHPPAKVLGTPVLVKRSAQEQTYGQTLRRFRDERKKQRKTVDAMLQSLSHSMSDDDLRHDAFRLNEVLRNGFIRLWHSDFALDKE